METAERKRWSAQADELAFLSDDIELPMDLKAGGKLDGFLVQLLRLKRTPLHPHDLLLVSADAPSRPRPSTPRITPACCPVAGPYGKPKIPDPKEILRKTKDPCPEFLRKSLGNPKENQGSKSRNPQEIPRNPQENPQCLLLAAAHYSTGMHHACMTA